MNIILALFSSLISSPATIAFYIGMNILLLIGGYVSPVPFHFGTFIFGAIIWLFPTSSVAYAFIKPIPVFTFIGIFCSITGMIVFGGYGRVDAMVYLLSFTAFLFLAVAAITSLFSRQIVRYEIMKYGESRFFGMFDKSLHKI